MIGPMKTTILRRLTASALSAHSRLTRTQLPVRNAFSENALSQLTHASGTTDSHVTTRFTPSLSPAPRDKQERDEWDQSDADFSTRYDQAYARLHRPIDWRQPSVPRPTTFKVMSWNIRGVGTTTATLVETIDKNDLDLVMLQELSTQYPKRFSTVPLQGYYFYGDARHKTGFYVRESIRHHHIPIPLHINPLIHEDTLWATAVLVPVQIGQRQKQLLFLNIYRSPNGKHRFDQIDSYIRHCTEYARSTLGLRIDGHLISGDFNASHTLWGARFHTEKSRQYGRQLSQYVADSRYQILNDGSPTRAIMDKRGLKLSWLDVTFASPLVADHTDWRCIQLDHQSDHYQIHIDLHSCVMNRIQPDYGPAEKHWKFTKCRKKWKLFQDLLRSEWHAVRDTIDVLGGQAVTEDASDQLSTLFQRCFTRSATSAFGTTSGNDRGWHKWIGREAQAASLDYHDYYRRYRAQDHHTRAETMKLKALRRRRNRVMKNHKASFLQRHFTKHKLQGREGWQIAAEVRNLNEHRGRQLPDLTNPQTGNTATSTVDKAEMMNAYYHRFDNVARHPASWCWRSDRVITAPTDYPPPREDRFFEHAVQAQPPLLRMRPQRHGDSLSGVNDVESLHSRFRAIVAKHTKGRWKRAKKDHAHYLTMLNSRISRAEIRRALTSFGNNKASGSDNLKIEFFKKGGETVLDMLETVFNIFFLKWNHIPRQFKERWITPIIKAKKKGTIPKELRPVSLTSYVAKIWEKIMVYRLSTYVIRLQLLSRCHFAYLSGRSTQDAFVYLVDRLQRSINRRIDAHCIFFDMTSAFDTVRLPQLLWKLEHEYFISGPFLLTLASFLSERQGRVKINGIFSDWRPDIIGVPQGGGLSPIIFIIYLDNLSLVETLQGVKISIYSDDLTIFTTPASGVDKKCALQEALLFVQWYTEQHGVLINHGKTNYKIFSHRKRDKPGTPHACCKRDVPFDLFLSGSLTDFLLERAGHPVASPTPDRILQEVSDTIRYLGYWLDDQLNFSDHLEILMDKIERRYYSMARNLRTLWHIQGDIVWHIIDACILSLFDYSALIWLMLTKTQQEVLTRLYNRMIHRVFNGTRGTNLIHEQHQCYALSLDRRMKGICSQYFTRLLRAPRSSMIYSEVDMFWWVPITEWCRLGRAPVTRNLRGKASWRDTLDDQTEVCYVASELKDTVIWRLIDNACTNRNDDFMHCLSVEQYTDIPHQISYTMDLTRPWIHDGLVDIPFTDDWSSRCLQRTPKHNDILLFTDGSVKDRIGGFGYHAITQHKYHGLLREHHYDRADYRDIVQRTDCFVPDYEGELSKRCSIDFAEAIAAREGLQAVLKKLRAESVRCDSWSRDRDARDLGVAALLGITGVRLILDSQVVLNWIAGLYRIRNPVMKEIIEDIHWAIKEIEGENPGVQVTYQWTKSHDDGPVGPVTSGNFQADYRAGRAMDRLYTDRKATGIGGDWEYYNIKAALAQDLVPFHEQQQDALIASVMKTTYGTVLHSKFMRDTTEESRKTKRIVDGYKWDKTLYDEMSHFSRDEIRILLALRTGHNHFGRYMSKLHPRRVNPTCSCGRATNCLEHVMRDCPDRRVAQFRATLISEGMKAIKRDLELKKESEPSSGDTASCVDPRDPLMYLFPLGVTKSTARHLKRLIVTFYRKCVGYRKRSSRR